MENTPTITMPVGEAKMLYQDYLEAVKTRKEHYLQELKQVYHHLSKGNQLLDIYEVFKTSGVSEEGEPKLAIALANEIEVEFRKQRLGAGVFETGAPRFHVSLPSGTFPDWEINPEVEWNEIIRQRIETKVPTIPAHLLPPGKLENYYILWEVSEWKPMPEYKDPLLLKRVNANAFMVLAAWDLTPIEQAVIRGR